MRNHVHDGTFSRGRSLLHVDNGTLRSHVSDCDHLSGELWRHGTLRTSYCCRNHISGINIELKAESRMSQIRSFLRSLHIHTGYQDREAAGSDVVGFRKSWPVYGRRDAVGYESQEEIARTTFPRHTRDRLSETLARYLKVIFRDQANASDGFISGVEFSSYFVS